MEIVFWLSLGLIVYCYLGYPLLMALSALVRTVPVRKGDIRPTVSVVLSVWNEADVIETKIRNLLALDYPAEKIEILIGSDHSDDGTDDIIRGFPDARVRFVAAPQRRGKTLMLNDLVAQAQNEIVVFTDARQVLDKDAVRQLVNNFADPCVGCVSGELVFFQSQGSATGRGVSLYWRYEKFIRACESRIHSMLGATGAIYAIRRELFTPLPAPVVLDDMFIPFQIIRKKFRAVFDGTAKAYDYAAEEPREEYRRKVRTLYGNYQIFALLPWMFNPFQSPVAWQLFSHKLLRLLAPFLLLAVLVSNFYLLPFARYWMVFVLQLLFYGLAVMEWLVIKRKYGIVKILRKIGYVPYVFCLLNGAALAGLWRFLRGGQPVTWQKARGQTQEVSTVEKAKANETLDA